MTTEEIRSVAQVVAEEIGDKMKFYHKEIFTLEEAAAYMSMSITRLYKLTHTRQIPFSKPGGKLCYFKRADLDNWMMSCPVATEAELNSRVMEYVAAKPLGRTRRPRIAR